MKEVWKGNAQAGNMGEAGEEMWWEKVEQNKDGQAQHLSLHHVLALHRSLRRSLLLAATTSLDRPHCDRPLRLL